ncbi:hypothetical protein GGI19_001966 [Coemansia pectinata]|uniref:Sfi1 spindle body domain-containing protein n=1 Tax=Coemansia pectinata TaxID=1052879 RepID=A0A9W8LCZ7_9FUNG|nr:hypothetical protein GGI19_001966 [Coemansia pectinata]
MEAAPLVRYGEQRKVNGITWSKQSTEDKPKPTPRILGRFNRSKRPPRPPSSISDTNDADGEHEQGHVSQRHDIYSRNESRHLQRISRTVRQPSLDSEFELLPESNDESLHEAAPVLHGFFASKSAATQRIVLASIFHSWLQMAEATRARRDELLRKWTEAMSFRNRQVVRHSLGIWRKATERAALESGGSYEKVQLKLATMHCRNLYLRRAFSRLMDSWDLQQRLYSWEAGAPQRLVTGCWIAWRARLAEKKHTAITLASDVVQKSTRANTLKRVLHCWQHQAMLKSKEQMFVQWRKGRVLRESVHVWRLQNVEKSYTQQKASPVKHSLVRWRDAAGTQRRERDCEMRNQSVLRQQLLAWHAVSQQMRGMESQADTLRQRALLYAPLDRLFDGLQARQTADAQATRFHRYQTMARAFEVWRHHCRARRDSQLQSRAIRDLARRRDQKQRRLIISAWREVAGRVIRAESYADELVSRRCRAMLVNCFRQWYASCSFDGIGQRAATITRPVIAPPPPLRSQKPIQSQLPTPVSAPVTNAQTMTSMIEEPPKRERAISIQTETAPSRAESDDRQELLRRVRVAEEEAKRYRSLYVDPKQVKMDIVAHEERLEGLLDQWNRGHRRRLLQSAFRQMRTRYSDGRHCQEQEQRLLAAVTRKYSDNRLRQALRQWRGLAQSQARDAMAADKHYYQLSRPANEEMCYNVLFEWRDQLKQKRQLVMSADKRRQVRVARKFLSTLLARFARQREMELEASSTHRMFVFSRTWAQLNQQFAMTRTSRVLTSMHISDREALLSIANVGPSQANAPSVPEPSVLDNTAMLDAQELENYFSAWRMLVEDVRDTQGAVMGRLPPLLQQRAVGSLSSAEGFDWGLLHQGHLLTAAIKKWRRLLPATRAARGTTQAPLISFGTMGSARRTSSEGDGPNAVELQRYEKMVVQGRVFRLTKTAFHRWMTANRGKLLEHRQLSQSLKRLVSAIASRVRQVKVAREKERMFQLRPAVNSWRTRYFINTTRMDNAQVQANASRVRLCLLHWVSQTRANPDNGRALYMKAIAFRWERQARRALAQWMRASSNDKVKVRLAQRAGRQRESQLQRIADVWSRARVLKNALDTLRGMARRRAVQHEMSLRLATAWGNANIQRYALSVWRQRMSPSSSMYFSVAESPV